MIQQDPFDIEAEKGFLCCLCQSRDLLAASTLPPDFIYPDKHKTFYAGLVELRDTGRNHDLKTLKAILNGKLDTKLIEEIWGYLDAAIDFEHYRARVQHQYQCRITIATGKRLIELGHAAAETTDKDVAEEAGRALSALNMLWAKPSKTFKQLVDETYDELMEESEHKEIKGVKFGIRSLDEALYGLRPTERCVIAAKTSFGKSTLAMLGVLDNAKAGNASALFSLEMTSKRIIRRMLSSLGSVSMSSMRRGTYLVDEPARLKAAYTELREFGIYLEDDYSFELDALVGRARELKIKANINLMVVDYLQLVNTRRGHGIDSMEQQVRHVSRTLGRLARELEVVLIALSQLNDQGLVSDSRSIGKDTDIMIRITESDLDNKFALDLVMDKGRDLARGARIPVEFHGEYMIFKDMES